MEQRTRLKEDRLLGGVWFEFPDGSYGPLVGSRRAAYIMIDFYYAIHRFDLEQRTIFRAMIRQITWLLPVVNISSELIAEAIFIDEVLN
jgi:hypothetical protein